MTLGRPKKYWDIIRKLRADHAKAAMEHLVRFHVDITVAELAAKYLPYVEAYYVKGGKPTNQTVTIKSAITKVLLAEHSHLQAMDREPARGTGRYLCGGRRWFVGYG